NQLTKRANLFRDGLLDGAHQIRWFVFQLIWIVRVDGDDRVSSLGVVVEGLGKPRRELAERIARRVFESRHLQALVAPDGLDQRRARAICGGRELAHERRRFDRRAAVRKRADDEKPLPRAEIQPDLYREVRILLKPNVEFR